MFIPIQYAVVVCGTGNKWYTLYSPQLFILMFIILEHGPEKPTIHAVLLTSPSASDGNVP